MKLRILFPICCLVFSASSVYGQAAPPDKAPDTATELRKGFTEVSGWVSQAAEMVPEDKYNYRPVDSVRTFGQLVAHITDSYNYFCARGAGNNVEWSDPIEKGNTDKATLIPKLKQAVDRCNELYKGSNGRVGPLLGNVGHTSLHYGNIITYMRMLGMKPPSSQSFCMAIDDMNWQEHLRTQGFAHFPGLTPEPFINAARDAIEIDLRSNYDPERQAEYDNRSYCPDLKGTTPIMNLLTQSPVLNILDAIFQLDKIDWDNGQIAIRRAHNVPQAIPPEPHIDGFASGLNGVEEGKIYNHTVLVGVFLTPLQSAFAGNFTVWPGSHYVYENYFRVRGTRAMSEPMPAPEIGEPVQLMCGVGDVVLAHYQLAHSAAVNTADIDRIAVYFRVWLRGIESDRWHYLTNMWDGWKL